MDITNPLFVNHIRVTLRASAMFFHLTSLRLKERNESLTKEMLSEKFKNRTLRYQEKIDAEHSKVCKYELISYLVAYFLVILGMVFPVLVPFWLF